MQPIRRRRPRFANPLPTCESALEWAFRGACATNDEQQRKGMQIQIK